MANTNLLLNLETYRQTMATMKQQLLANDQANLDANYTALIAALTADQAIEQAVAGGNVDLLTQ